VRTSRKCAQCNKSHKVKNTNGLKVIIKGVARVKGGSQKQQIFSCARNRPTAIFNSQLFHCCRNIPLPISEILFPAFTILITYKIKVRNSFVQLLISLASNTIWQSQPYFSVHEQKRYDCPSDHQLFSCKITPDKKRSGLP
jgi:hypothetical protein